MNTEKNLEDRSGSKCELCTSTDNLVVFQIPDSPQDLSESERSVFLCGTCVDSIKKPESADNNHWHCLNDSMWTPVAAVQVIAWRTLNSIKAEGWPQDLLEMLYLEDDIKAWAEAGTMNTDNTENPDNDEEQTRDSNGALLNAGDTVTLIKDLVVKGANFTAKRGTVVKNISLTSNPLHIEGRVNGTRIVLVSAFLKKA